MVALGLSKDVLINVDCPLGNSAPTVVVFGTELGVEATLSTLVRQLQSVPQLGSKRLDGTFANPAGFGLLNGVPNVDLVGDDNG